MAERRPKPDRRLLKALTDRYSRGAIVIIGTTDVVGRAIREGQRKLTPDGEPSRWSHCFLCGETRLTLDAQGRKQVRKPYIFESDLNVELDRTSVRNGAQENRLSKWCRSTVEHCAVIDTGLTGKQADRVLAAALHLVDRQVRYPVQDLVGTWLAIVNSRLWRANPLKSRNAMYCSAYVRHCYRRAGRDFVPGSVNLSNTAPEHIARHAADRGFLEEIR